jgi:hypothetical protein
MPKRHFVIPALFVIVAPLLVSGYLSPAMADQEDPPTAEVSNNAVLFEILDMLGSLNVETEASPFVPPGQGGTPPGQGGPFPGHADPPGHGGTPPGQDGEPPAPPGHDGNPPPGQGGTPPGHNK